jgi:membrane-associated phospholipid phosphatase
MASLRFTRALDYNRGLAAPVRGAHALWALAADALDHLRLWGAAPPRRGWALPLLLGSVGVALLWPFDEMVSAWARSFRPRGDVQRELEAVQQFGQLTFSLLIGLAVLLLDERRRRRVLDWGAGALLAVLATNLAKGLVGRPRPALNDPHHITGPLGLYPVPRDGGAFELLSGWTGGYDLASFPSRHAAMAAVAAAFLIVVYPRLRALAIGLVLTVMAARVITGAHYASDTIAGAALGAACALPALRGYWGTRLIDLVWRRVIDPQATPAYPALKAACGD